MTRADISAGKAFVTLYAKTSDFYQGVKDAKDQLQSFGQSLLAIGAIVKTIGGELDNLGQHIQRIGRQTFLAGVSIAGMGVSIASTVGLAVRHFAVFGESLAKMSDRTGMGIQALSEMGYAAEVAGTSIDELELGIRQMQQQIAKGDRFGLRGLPTETQIEVLADRFVELTSVEDRAAMAIEMFGRAGTRMLPMLAGGSAGIRGLREEAVRLGRAITPEEARAAERVRDAWQALTRTVAGAAFSAGAALGDEVVRILRYLTRVAGELGSWIKRNQAIVKAVAVIGIGMAAVGTAVSAAGVALHIFGGAVSGVAALIGITARLAGIILPIMTAIRYIGMPVIAGFVGTITSAIGASGLLASAMSLLGTVFGAVITPLAAIFGGVTAAIAALIAIVIAATAAATAWAYAFWKLADPFRALAPLARSVFASIQKIIGALMSGNFEGAATMAVDGIRDAMILAVSAVFQMIKNTLERLPQFIARIFSGASGLAASFVRVIRHTFTTLWPAMQAAAITMFNLAKDVLLQLPRIAAYSAGLIIREFALAFGRLQVWLLRSMNESLLGLGKMMSGLGPELLKSMLSGDMSGFQTLMTGVLAKAIMGSMLATGGFISGIAGGAPPGFALSPETQAAYARMMGELSRAGGAVPGRGQGGQGTGGLGTTGAFVTYSASALQTAGRGTAVDKMHKTLEAHKAVAEKMLIEAKEHRKATTKLAEGLRHG